MLFAAKPRSWQLNWLLHWRLHCKLAKRNYWYFIQTCDIIFDFLFINICSCHMQYHLLTCVTIICSIIYQHIYFLYAAQFTDMSSYHIQHHLSMYIFIICCKICQQWQTLYYVNERHLYKIYWFLELLWRKFLTFCDFLSSWEI